MDESYIALFFRAHKSSHDRIDRSARGPTFSRMRATTSTAPDPPAPVKPTAKDPLLAGICHDLRAPLAAVTMGANFVLQTTPEDEASSRSRRVLQAMLRSCKQMERLVRDFGDLSQIESDAVELRSGIHDAGQMLAIAVEAYREAATARTITIHLVELPTPIVLRCDRERVLRALDHVLENALRHAPDGSTIAVAAEERTGDVAFSVTDAGAGLSNETLEHLYDRTWHSRRASRVGAGLGLAIVRGFLEAHAGRVEVDSRPGATTFSLLVPRDTASVPDVSALLSPGARPSRS